jgi:hypothetical protein
MLTSSRSSSCLCAGGGAVEWRLAASPAAVGCHVRPASVTRPPGPVAGHAGRRRNSQIPVLLPAAASLRGNVVAATLIGGRDRIREVRGFPFSLSAQMCMGWGHICICTCRVIPCSGFFSLSDGID